MDSTRPARVFISSAGGGLAPYRTAAADVCRRLGLVAVHMEEFSPERPAPVEVCRREVASCDVLVLLLAYRYGSRPAGESLSYTELEYRWALAEPDMAIVPFRVDPALPWLPSDIDRGADEVALNAFVHGVEGRHVVRRFGDLTRFREDLIIALHRYEAVAVAAAPLAARAPAFHSVPPYVGSAPFTGRAADLEALDRWAAAGDPVMVVDAIGGTGKSALTWEWATTRAPGSIPELAGRMWWSFYDGSASMTRFLQEVLGYTTGRPTAEIAGLDDADLLAEAGAALRSRPYLLVMDGLERLLIAYQRIDPSHRADEDAAKLPHALIDPRAYDVLRDLAAARPSRILVSTRLFPDAFEGRFGRRLPGVGHLRLPGLSDADTLELLHRLGVRGDPGAVAGFMGQLGNHPLLVGVVAGLVNDYRADPGSFDRWRADPAAGGSFALGRLDLTQRRTHILASALDLLHPDSRTALGWMSQLEGSVEWETLAAINPFREAPGIDDLADEEWDENGSERAFELNTGPSPEATGRLDRALTDLEHRGLLWWDRRSNSYDLHPIVRGFAHSRLDGDSRAVANRRISAHFEPTPHREKQRLSSIEDLRNSIALFRALVGAEMFFRASTLWARRLRKSILLDLGATGTAIELLTPLARAVRNHDRVELAFAFYQAGRYAAALEQDLLVLDSKMSRGELGVADLENVIEDLLDLRRDAWAQRYLDLWTRWTDSDADSAKVRQRGILAAKRGDVADARADLDLADQIGPGPDTIWFYADINWWPLYLDLRADESLTELDLDHADQAADTWLERWRLRRLRRELRLRHGEWEPALAVSLECDRMERAAGVESVPATTAYLLARVGRTAEAEVALEETLNRLSRVEDSVRPHLAIAQALHALGRGEEAAEHALAAYRQAWGDGPPYSHHWELQDARAFLRVLDLPEPEITIDPDSLKAPYEDELRAYLETH